MQIQAVLLLVLAATVSQLQSQQSATPGEPQKGRGASADATLTFTVASVKPSQLPPAGAAGRQGGFAPLTEPGRLRFPAVTLKTLLMFAYDMKDFQIVGPDWLGDERFAVEATMPADTTQDQTRTMLRNLIASRFKTEIHRETRQLPIYSLVIAKSGLKIPSTPPRPKQIGDSNFSTDGFPLVPAEFTGVLTFVINGQAKITAQQATMHDLATELERRLGVPVRDETQLTDKFDFVVKFSPEGLIGPGGRRGLVTAAPDAPEPLGDIFSALQSEIGAKLESKKGPVEVIVIDHAEKVPTEN